jgi:LacI family transcriptional regulator
LKRVADYLVDIGHRTVAMLSGIVAGNDRVRARVAGVHQALAARGIELAPHHLIEAPYALPAARAAMATLLATRPRPTAVICGNDVLAMGAVLECHAQSIDVPADVSVTGFDDIEAASILVPALTTVRVPMHELGYAAAQQILAHIGGNTAVRTTELAVDLIVRGTTAPPRRGPR